ncbi:MAG TPA: lipopolysaccharide biosynthesis protein [Candidatus Edwardsbacteria bacterium]|nr:lipopolysaccharide biosynthesis protein [Candidatus Edwardsbacteria bacterium]
MSIGRKAVSGTVWIGAGSIVSRAIVFATGVVLARLLSPEVFGQFAMAIMAINFLALFQNPGISQELVQRNERLEEAADTAFTLALLIGVALAIVAAVLSPLLSAFYGIGLIGAVTAVLGLRLLINAASIVPGAIVQKRFQYRYQFLGLVVSQIGYAAAAIGLGVARCGVWSLVIGHVVMAALSTALLWRAWGRWPRPRLDRAIVGEIWGYGKHLAAAGIFIFAYTNLDTLLIGKVRGAEQLGYYTLAYTLATMPVSVVAGIGDYVMFPIYCKLLGDGRDVTGVYFRAYRTVLVGVLPLLAVLLFTSGDIVQVLYGRVWAPSAPLLRVLLLLAFCQTLSAIGGSLLLALRRTNLFSWLAGGSVTVVAVAGYPVATRWGASGIALLFSSVLLANVVVLLLLLARCIGTKAERYLGTILPVLVPALAFAAGSAAACRGMAPAHRLLIALPVTYVLTTTVVLVIVPEFRGDMHRGWQQLWERLVAARDDERGR